MNNEHLFRLAVSRIEDHPCHLLHNIACTTSTGGITRLNYDSISTDKIKLNTDVTFSNILEMFDSDWLDILDFRIILTD
jgi:hypothetical protein